MMMYATARSVQLSPAASSVVGAGALLDLCILVEARLVLTDAALVLATCAQILCSARSDNFRPCSLPWICWTFLSGVAIGCAFSIKWTGLSAMAVAGLHALTSLHATARGVRCGPTSASASQLHRTRLVIREFFLRGLLQAALPVCIYVGCFALHFWLLPFNGPGVRFHTPAFRAALTSPPLPPSPPHSLIHLSAGSSRAAEVAAASAASVAASSAADRLANSRWSSRSNPITSPGSTPPLPPAPPPSVHKSSQGRTPTPSPRGMTREEAPMGFWAMMFELNREMLKSNAQLRRGHSWGSRWWEWPLMLRTVLYWVAKSDRPPPPPPNIASPREIAATASNPPDLWVGSAVPDVDDDKLARRINPNHVTLTAGDRESPIEMSGSNHAERRRHDSDMKGHSSSSSPYMTAHRRFVRIYCIGNPFVWWLCAITVLALPVVFVHLEPSSPSIKSATTGKPRAPVATEAIARLVFSQSSLEARGLTEVEPAACSHRASAAKSAHSISRRWLLLLSLGYTINWLPFAAVARVAFLYHFLPSLLHALLLLGVALDTIVRAL
mmetsp:Transcript_13885/g.42281  ORF Transcript_13885/g.42281 Transcript_13885/m.42281 type:complete len:555 (-) Transcript_13885:699-2363(-)